MKDFSLQGRIFLHTRNADGSIGAGRWVGDAPEGKVSFSVEEEKRRESYSGKRMVSAVLSKGIEGSISLTLNYASIENLALGLHGTAQAVSGTSVTGETAPTGLVAGDWIATDKKNVSALTITDSAGSPATLVAGTHYRLVNAFGGAIELLNVTGFTQPFKLAYTSANTQSLTMFTQEPQAVYLSCQGMNTVKGSTDNVVTELYKVTFNPMSELGFIQDSFGAITLEGDVLYDETRADDSAYGGFGRITQAAT